MSFFSDLGSFLGEVQEFSEQVNTTKQQVVSSVVDTVAQGQQAVTQIGDELADTATTVKQTVTDTTADISQTLSDAK